MFARSPETRAHQAEIDAEYRQAQPRALGDIGTTRELEILPLLDWHSARADLATDAGVAYLVRTDGHTILFDLGNNSADRDPSPLAHNLRALGVRLEDVDTVVISHAHFDHVGGKHFTNGDLSGTTFGIGHGQPDLAGKRVLVPVPMTYPGIAPERTREATRIGPGVSTTGTIRRSLFGGPTEEQALAVNVEGKGIVLIVGCGHQTLVRLLELYDQVFNAPLYGIVGGLHLPVPKGRMQVVGLDAQRRFASGDGPFSPLSEADVEHDLARLEQRKLGLVAIGGHDSSDDVIAAAHKRFGAAHRYLRVGEPIRVEMRGAHL